MPSKALFDSNILVYFLNLAAANHQMARELIEKVIKQEFVLYLSIQNLNECLRVSTSPKAFSQPLSLKEALEKIEKIEELTHVVFPNSDTYSLHKALLRKYPIKPKNLYDNFLVATMISYGVETIYTANDADFNIYKEIQALNPFKPK